MWWLEVRDRFTAAALRNLPSSTLRKHSHAIDRGKRKEISVCEITVRKVGRTCLNRID
jgi:hypothetical protein